MEKPLEILIVEDQEENREAAKEFFNGVDGVNADFAGNYEEALQKLEQKIYAAAILDIKFPRGENSEPEKLGPELGRDLDTFEGKYRLPHVYLTGGYYHHGEQAKIFIDLFCYEGETGSMTADKKKPEAWQDAYQKLTEIAPPSILREIVRAKERHQKYVNKCAGQDRFCLKHCAHKESRI